MFFKKKKYNVLVLGNKGMLGKELYERLTLLSMSKLSNIGTVVGIDKDNIDLTNRYAIGNFFFGSIHFDYCINCAAHTDTKAAETTKEGKELDYKLNALVPKYIAEICKFWKTKLIHISTDYVFSEFSDSAVYNQHNSPLKFNEDSQPFPINVYGYNKLLGEINIKEVFGKKYKEYCIMRVSWLYGKYNNKSFIHKFISNLVKTAHDGKTETEMTSNEYSVPTSCKYVIDCIMNVMSEQIYGIYHAIPECGQNGVSRFEFAEYILKFIKDNQLFLTSSRDKDIKLVGIKRDTYQPKYSVMKSSATNHPISWQNCLNDFLSKNIEDILKCAIEQN